MELRRLDGLPGMAIEWGAIGDVGMLADFASASDKEVVVAGTIPQRIPSCFAALEIFLSTDHHTIFSCFIRAESRKNFENTGEDVFQAIAKIIGVADLNELDPEQLFSELGIDSLMAVEIRQVLESRCDLTLPLKDLRMVNQIFTQIFTKNQKSKFCEISDVRQKTPRKN